MTNLRTLKTQADNHPLINSKSSTMLIINNKYALGNVDNDFYVLSEVKNISKFKKNYPTKPEEEFIRIIPIKDKGLNINKLSDIIKSL